MKIPVGIKYIIGIDEAGRGPLAGPVAAGVCVVPAKMTRKNFRGIKDSKKLTKKGRDFWFEKLETEFKAKNIHFSVTLVSNKIIDEKGISFAIRKAMSKSLQELFKKLQNLNNSECLVL